MLKRVIFKSLYNRKRQLIVASVAVLLAGTLIAALATISQGMKSQVSSELQAYGANIVLVPWAVSLPAGTGQLAFGEISEEAFIAEQDLDSLGAGKLDEVLDYAPYLYTVATYQDKTVVVTGTLFDNLKPFASSWRIEGEWASAGRPRGAVIGRKVAQNLAIQPGDSLSLDFGSQSRSFEVSGIVDVGGSEDNQIFVDLETVQSLSGRLGQVDLVQLRASAENRPLADVAADIESNLAGVEAKVVGQIAGAQQSVLSKIQLLLALIALLVLVSSAVAVFSTLSTSVFERIKEIGLMKALGASNRRIAMVFLAEAWFIGLTGGLLGNVLGIGMAEIIAKTVFDAFVSPQILAILITLGVSLFVATVAALGPVRNALSVTPITTLRGE
jgi:putative ABC transport system permease protein